LGGADVKRKSEKKENLSTAAVELQNENLVSAIQSSFNLALHFGLVASLHILFEVGEIFGDCSAVLLSHLNDNAASFAEILPSVEFNLVSLV
jgi:hypothetical protein